MSNLALSQQSVPYSTKHFNFWLDAPAFWTGQARRLTLSGWCLPKDGSPLTALRAIIGFRTFGIGLFHRRPDVIEHMAGVKGQLWCGFSLGISAPPGKWRLRVEARTEDTDYQCVWERVVEGPTFTTGSSEAEDDGHTAERNELAWWLDRPSQWVHLERILPVCGWCLHRSPAKLTGVRARVGGRIFLGTYGIQRPDLRASFPESPYAHCAGFAVTAKLPRGRAQLVLEARDSAGEWHPFFARAVIRQPGSAPGSQPPLIDAELFDPNRRDLASRFAYWLEPRCNWGRLPKNQRLAGWCLALDGAPAQDIRARIGRHTWTAQSGIKRPEVKAAFPDTADALNSGFSVTIHPPLGWSLLQLEARSSKGWAPFFAYRIYRPLFWRRGENRFGATSRYEQWLRLYDKIYRADRHEIRRHIETFERRPKFSVLIPCYNSNHRFLQSAIESVQKQLYSNWEICAIDDASPESSVWSQLRRATRQDHRVRVERRNQRGGISAASDNALRLATGDYIVLLDHDDELAEHALYFAALALNENPDLHILYADEDKIDENGSRFAPYFKPEWNPDLFLVQNYTIHPTIVQTELARSVGGFDSQYDGAQDHDLLLRCSEKVKPEQIKRIPWLLYHWRTTSESTADVLAAKPYALDARQRAVQAHLQRRDIEARVLLDGDNQRVQYAAGDQLVSIIIATRNQHRLLRNCISSIQKKTDYAFYEIIIIDNGSNDPEARQLLQELENDKTARVLSAPGEFNYSRLCNLGAAISQGKILLLLNNDVEVVSGGWLTELVSQVLRPNVGAVGALLLFPDNRLQHAGIVLNPQRVGSYSYFRQGRTEPGYFSQLRLVRDVAAVTGACLAVRADVYAKLGGLNEQDLGIAFNDVDFCLRLRELNLRVVWTPHAELVHHESSSRGLEDTQKKQSRFQRELCYMQERWGSLLENDPFYNPNLDLADELYTLAFPPRLKAPWKVCHARK